LCGHTPSRAASLASGKQINNIHSCAQMPCQRYDTLTRIFCLPPARRAACADWKHSANGATKQRGSATGFRCWDEPVLLQRDDIMLSIRLMPGHKAIKTFKCTQTYHSAMHRWCMCGRQDRAKFLTDMGEADEGVIPPAIPLGGWRVEEEWGMRSLRFAGAARCTSLCKYCFYCSRKYNGPLDSVASAPTPRSRCCAGARKSANSRWQSPMLTEAHPFNDRVSCVILDPRH